MFGSSLTSRLPAAGRSAGWAIVAIVIAALAIPAGLHAAVPETSAEDEQPFTTGSSHVLLTYINDQIRQQWENNLVEPSPVASDEEWVRRVYLDIVGHIPEAEAVEKFVNDTDPAKRANLIEELLASPDYVRNWTTVWTNLMIGRRTPEEVSRRGLRKFLREAFARNRPWDKIVYDVITAEGHFERNGAVNYLLAQIQADNTAVQATAKTTRLFLGIQVQCTQCHNHPFNDWKQNQFWEFNSFFRQLAKREVEKYDPRTGEMEFDYAELVYKPFSGPVFYDERSAVRRVAYPEYFDKKVDPGAETDRRKRLGELMIEGEQPLIARAFVNRMWGHFFGYGFTKPVDDMGPHNPASHPDLLDRLATEFVDSGYDVKQLIRWIANSEAYNLTSRFGKKNEIDNPAAGEVPLFSHMYVKQMTAEQLFDSLIIATEAHKSGRLSWDEAEQQRRQWMQQFVVAFDNDENEETTTFNGTIPQALMMMNGELIQDAVNIERGSYLRRVLQQPGRDSRKIRQLYLSTLSRHPSRAELTVAKRIIGARRNDKISAYQDLFWALLNSNEFILVH